MEKLEKKRWDYAMKVAYVQDALFLYQRGAVKATGDIFTSAEVRQTFKRADKAILGLMREMVRLQEKAERK